MTPYNHTKALIPMKVKKKKTYFSIDYNTMLLITRNHLNALKCLMYTS